MKSGVSEVQNTVCDQQQPLQLNKIAIFKPLVCGAVQMDNLWLNLICVAVAGQ